MIVYRSRAIPGALVLVMLLLTASASAVTPTAINYQGRLSDAFGSPVPDSDYSVTFTIYDAAAGGNSKWTETQTVTTADGMFAVLLGSVNPITDSVFNDSTRYLGMKVGADAEMSPRTVIVSVPFSFRAAVADAAQSSNSAEYADSADAITDGGIDLSDIGQNGASSGQIIKWNGSAWEAATDATGGGGTGWNWSDSSSHGPDSVRYADSSSYAASAGSVAVSDSTGAITDGGIDLADLGQNGAANNQILKWNGSAWTVADDATTAGGWTLSGNTLKLSDGTDSVGIGVSSPAAKFDVDVSSSDTTVAIRSHAGGAGTNYGMYSNATGGTVNYGLYAHANDTSVWAANIGLYAVAENGDENIGLWVKAAGNKAMAAYFDGYVNMQGSLNVGGNLAFDAGSLANGTVLFEDIGRGGATTDQVIKWNGSAWAASDVLSSGAVQFSHIAQNGAASDQIMKWNGSAWAASDVLGSGAVQFSHIGDNGATSGQVMKWNGSAWTAANDEGGSVEAGAGLQKDTTGGITTLSIANGGITSSMLGYQSVTSSDLGPNSVNTAHISSRTINANDIGWDVITADEIATGGVTTDEIADQTIKDADISTSAAIHKTKIEGTAVTVYGAQSISGTKFFESPVVVGGSSVGGHQLRVTSVHTSGPDNATAKIQNTDPAGVALFVENNSTSDYAAHTTNLAAGPVMRCENANGTVMAVGTKGTRMFGYDGWWAAEFYGNVAIRANDGLGTMLVELGEGLDYAEGFDVSEADLIEPGAVLSIDPASPGELCLANEAYDRKVAGIVAGANQLGSGVRLGADQFDHDVALAGRVYCNVDASFGAIQPGDLLTTSPTPGHAMIVKDYNKAQGAIIGKAMEPIKAGEKGQILVLVTLQ